jgi:diaminopropionate ammonia-lyase
MLDESDQQVSTITGGKPATHTIIPVRCGSIAQAVTQHYKSADQEKNKTPAATVITVELTTAACLKASLEAGKTVQVKTENGIMCGINCGTLSTAAWSILQAGVNATVIVGELESHHAVEELQELGVSAGPCGAATLAVLQIICSSTAEREKLGRTI